MTFNCNLESAGLSNDFILPLNDVKNRPKFNENPFRGEGNIEQTRNARLKLDILECGLDLESAWLSHEFCTPSYCDEHFTKVK